MKIKKYSINSKNLIFLATECIKSSKIAENIEDFAAKNLLTYTTIFLKTDEIGQYTTGVWHNLLKSRSEPSQNATQRISCRRPPTTDRRLFVT